MDGKYRYLIFFFIMFICIFIVFFFLSVSMGCFYNKKKNYYFISNNTDLLNSTKQKDQTLSYQEGSSLASPPPARAQGRKRQGLVFRITMGDLIPSRSPSSRIPKGMIPASGLPSSHQPLNSKAWTSPVNSKVCIQVTVASFTIL